MGPRPLPDERRNETEWHRLHGEWTMLWRMVYEIETGEIAYPTHAQFAFERCFPEWRCRNLGKK